MVGTNPTVPARELRVDCNSLRPMTVSIHATPDCIGRKSVLHLRYKPQKGENTNGLRVYQLEGCDLLLAYQEVDDFHRQGTDPVLLLEGSQGRHARRGAGRLRSR